MKGSTFTDSFSPTSAKRNEYVRDDALSSSSSLELSVEGNSLVHMAHANPEMPLSSLKFLGVSY